MKIYSNVVTEGMNRACDAFSEIVQPLGFNRGSGRKWLRNVEGFDEAIFILRSGATDGAPGSPSVSLKLSLSSSRISDGKTTHLSHDETQKIRRDTGYCYHHRFNAETSSTFDRCLQALDLFVAGDCKALVREAAQCFTGRFALTTQPFER